MSEIDIALAAIEAAQAELAQLAERAKTEAPAPVDDKEVADARAKHTQLRDEITRIAAAQVAAKNAGELVDFQDYPVIDFGRDSVETIREKLLQRQVYGAMRGDGAD